MTSSQKWQYAKPAPTPGKVCKDCKDAGRPLTRPAPHPGPRCSTDHREELRRRRMSRKVRHVETTKGLPPEEYDALYAYQGGRCAICRRATGATKRLAVDHDHRQALLDGHDPDKGCRNCVRALVCSLCNDVLAHFRDDPAAGHRVAEYLTHWPFRRMAEGASWPPPFQAGERVR